MIGIFAANRIGKTNKPQNTEIAKSEKIGFIGVDLYEKLRNMKMLLIDDDEWIRDSLSIFFESEGCSLKAFETAEEGLKALKKQPYDIIIVDYRLPGMDGLDFLRRIKNSCPNAIKIMVTAYGNKEIISEAKQIGIQDFLEKPISSKSIETSLSRSIEEHDQQSIKSNDSRNECQMNQEAKKIIREL